MRWFAKPRERLAATVMIIMIIIAKLLKMPPALPSLVVMQGSYALTQSISTNGLSHTPRFLAPFAA